ncbi:hypothetical protein HELRODRAFT_166014 [Helobdella robusta]|uniref:Uncharacterized protein n=1 Tax=Helobdella robusta TaxID=6412 RepID=T1EXL3_HELRO|nr:hypothetical protein HELRODRAFT_166014 [Helobdella robusta]ESN90356.1 hypothetical protein HELRODRAFT_166014 [Helobdella robusta]
MIIAAQDFIIGKSEWNCTSQCVFVAEAEREIESRGESTLFGIWHQMLLVAACRSPVPQTNDSHSSAFTLLQNTFLNYILRGKVVTEYSSLFKLTGNRFNNHTIDQKHQKLTYPQTAFDTKLKRLRIECSDSLLPTHEPPPWYLDTVDSRCTLREMQNCTNPLEDIRFSTMRKPQISKISKPVRVQPLKTAPFSATLATTQLSNPDSHQCIATAQSRNPLRLHDFKSCFSEIYIIS